MVGRDQGGRSSRPLSTLRNQWRKQLRRLDRKCAEAERLFKFQRAFGIDTSKAERMYQQADMQRMLTRQKIKAFT